MTDDVFWGLIDKLNWNKLGDDDAVIRPVVNALAKLAVEDIYAFDEVLAQKLHDLDTEAHALNMIAPLEEGGEDYLSPDEFLYARCAVVANGEALFEQILNNPSEFPADIEFEAILYVAELAYQKSTNQEAYEYVPTVNYETFSNREGWPNLVEEDEADSN